MMIHMVFEIEKETIRTVNSLQFFIAESEVGNEIHSIVSFIHNDFMCFR